MKNHLVAWIIVLFVVVASGLEAQKGKGGKGGGGASPPADPTIAFAGQGMADELSVINADGSNKRVIFTSNQWIGAPSWNPGGGTVAFTHGSVIIVNRSNGAVVIVLSPGLDIAGRRPLRWARTSDTLALCARLPNTFGASLHTMSIANPTPVLIVLEKAWEPAWSPDDARILFTEAVGSSKLKTVELATGSTRTLANQTGPGDWRR